MNTIKYGELTIFYSKTRLTRLPVYKYVFLFDDGATLIHLQSRNSGILRRYEVPALERIGANPALRACACRSIGVATFSGENPSDSSRQNGSNLFGIIHTKSNKYMNRYQFAYNAEEFTRDEIVFLIRSIFGFYEIPEPSAFFFFSEKMKTSPNI